MKNSKLLMSMLVALSMAFASCSSTSTEGSNSTDTEQATAEYQCPMKCEGEKTYAEKGDCPVCGMHLKEI